MSARAMNRLAALCVVLALLAIGAAALWRLAQQPKFQLKRIDVRGDLPPRDGRVSACRVGGAAARQLLHDAARRHAPAV